ncbi:MAG: DUF4037 domain-containing protein, partial [Oscillospiraceae bacterium]|nr:DUF4037 domain-containing protein [Oscillospiraceae bacterium]
MDYWAERGVMIDGVWMRHITEIDEKLNKWLSGTIEPETLDWAVYGYYLPTDIYNQQIVEDPYNIALDWKKRMEPYPQAMKTAVITKHMNNLRYWTGDYHYRNKVERKDIVFLASLSARLVHDMMQVLCAVNGIYFPGDGHNLSVAGHFALKPDDFVKKIEFILYPGNSDRLSDQYMAISDMVKEIETIISFQ